MKNEMLREEMLKEAIHQSVAGKAPTVEFEKIREESQRFQIQSVAAEYMRRIDDTTYTFKRDKEVLGPWTVVDLVEKESEFVPDETRWKSEDFYLRLMDFHEDGTISIAVGQNGKIIEFPSPVMWTKDHIISKQDETNSEVYH